MFAAMGTYPSGWLNAHIDILIDCDIFLLV